MTFRLLLLLACFSLIAPAQAGTFSEDVSDATFPLIGLASVLPVVSGSDSATAKAARRYDGVIVAIAVTSLIKETVHEWRPDRSDARSFPSGHTAAAFALAGALSEEKPKQKWLYLGLAALVGWARVDSDKHYWHDVVAGAAIGYSSGRWSAASGDGILIGRVFRF